MDGEIVPMLIVSNSQNQLVGVMTWNLEEQVSSILALGTAVVL